MDSIQDQGYMSLKSKEIRDSESPTRDIHGKIIRNDSYSNKSYDIKLMDNTVVLPNSQDWTTSQTSNYLTNVDGNTVTESAERQSSAVLAKDNENITLNAHEKQAFSSTDNSKDGNIDKSTTLQESADLVQNSSYQDDNTSFEAVSKQKQDTSVTSSVKQIGNVTSYSTSSRTASSKSSSSKTVTSSSKIISSKNLAIDSGDDFVDKTLSIKQNEIDDEVQAKLSYDTKKTSKVDRTVRKRSSTASLSDAIQKRNSLTSNQIHDVNESDYYIDNSDTTNIRSSRIVENRSDSSSSIQSSKIIKNQSETSSKLETLKTTEDSSNVDDYNTRQNLKNSETSVSRNEITDNNQTYTTKNLYDNSSTAIGNERTTDSTKIDIVENETPSTRDVSDVNLYNSRKDIKTSHLANINTTSTTENRNVDQNIMTEISNLDSYLSTHPTSTPVSPRSAVTDHDYQDARRAPVKHPSTLDLPKECTEGQYVTTYSDSYKNRISTNYDVSPTHNAFASSLRADTPERSPSSPTRAFSSDRKSPRSSPEKYNTRSVSENRYRKSPEKTPTRDSPHRFSKHSPESVSVRASPDRYQSRKSPEKTPTRDVQSRKSPERTPSRSSPNANTTRLSPTKSSVHNQFGKQPTATSPTRKSPDRSYNKLVKETDVTRKAQDRRMSSSSYTIETKKDTNKSKRKFSSAQSKDAAKKRISTPKVSPDTSPTRNGNTSDSSNDSQGTYNTSTRKTQDVTRSDGQDTYSVTENTYTKSSEYTRSDSHDTYNKYRRDSTDTYDKDKTDRNESRNSYTIDTEEDTHEFERSDSTDSFNVKKLRKDSKDITKQELKQRKLLSESETENVKTTRTNDFIRTEISENVQQNSYKSPSVSPVRQKSPEYSSEGSITKEIKLVNSLTDKNLTLIEQAEEINIDIRDSNETSASVTPCTSPDSYQTAPRRPSILKKKTTDSQINQELKTQTSAFESQKTPQQSPIKSRPSSPEKSFIQDQAIQNTTERKSSILKTSSKLENRENTFDTKTTERKSSILKSSVKNEKSPERNVEGSYQVLKDEYEFTVTEQSRKSPVRESPKRARKSPSSTKSPRESPTRSAIPFESRLTSPTQASLIREQNISETFDLTVKERRSPTKSPLREEAPRQLSPHKSPVRDTKSPEKSRKTPVREKASPQRVPSKPVEKRPTRKSSIPRAESLKSINKRPASTTPTRQQTPKVTTATPKATTPTPKITPSKTPSQRNLTPQQSKSAIKTTPQRVPVTSRTNSANLSKTSTLVKTNSYSSRRATEPVKQAKPTTPVVQTKIPTKTPVKQAPKVSKQTSTKKLPVKSTKSTKDLKTNVTKKQTKTTINVEEEIRASNKTLQDILTREQQEYDSEIDSEVPPEEFLVEDDDEFCEITESTRTESKSYFTNKQDQIRRETADQQDSSSDEENENIKITKAKRVDETHTNKQNEDLLSVVVQLPNSSRESTPGVKNTGAHQVPYTSDINQPDRYADYYSEPETDNEKTIKSAVTSQYEQVTDLDEETIDLNVSVADRVNKFLNSTRTDVDKENTQTVIEQKSVSQAKNMFENIAKSQSSPKYNDNITKSHVKPLSSRQPVSEEVCESKTYYEVNHAENLTTNDFINIEKESISQQDYLKKSPKDIYLEKTNGTTTTPQKPVKGAQPQKKVFDDTYYIEKNKRKQEDNEKTNLNKTTIDSCDEYIEIKEEYDVKKKSPKDIYLEKTQKSTSKTNIVETQKKTTDVVEENKPEVKQVKRVPSTSLNNTKSKKNFFEEKINIEAEKSKSTLKTNRTSDKVFKSEKKSPVRQSPTRKSPENNKPKAKSPARQSPARKSPEKAKCKYDARKDSLMEIRASNIIAERRTKFSPLKENQTEPVGRKVKNVSSKENIKPSEKKTDRKGAERKSQDRTTTSTTKNISNDITQDKFTKERKPSVERVQRKSSSKFEERRASFENRTISERKISSEMKQSERRISSDRTVAESRKSKSRSPEPKANQDQSSPARKVSKKSTSPDYDAKPNQKQDSFSNKFGVALKKTSKTSSTNVTAKSNTTNVLKASNKNTTTSTTDSIFDIESIFDLELLEKMVSSFKLTTT